MKSILYIIIALILIGAGTGIYWNYSLAPINPGNKTEKVFVITRGEAGKTIGENLQKNGFIKNAFTFNILLKQLGGGNKIQAGDYRLSLSMSAKTIIDTFHHGTLDAWVTFPEGLRGEEYVSILSKNNLKNYSDDWKASFHQFDGYLFPDTYLIPTNADQTFILNLLQNTFYKRAASVGITKQNPKLDQIVIIASLLEREAKTPDEKKIVASIIYNRLAAGMPLQIDASIQYALGYQPSQNSWWKKNLTLDDLNISSPFNTYKHTSLPPHPICNPGLESLTAAVNPAQTDYLYYISDKSGHLHYAKTLAEHNRNIAKYLGK